MAKETEIVLYNPNQSVNMEVRLEDETVWLTQAQMAELFEKDRTVITRHINNVFDEGELNREEVCANFAHTTRHGAIEGKQQNRRSKNNFPSKSLIDSIKSTTFAHTRTRQASSQCLNRRVVLFLYGTL